MSNDSLSSDADSDVLADYVLALIRADTPEPELRLNAIENLEDFLKDSRYLFSLLVFTSHNRMRLFYVTKPFKQTLQALSMLFSLRYIVDLTCRVMSPSRPCLL